MEEYELNCIQFVQFVRLSFTMGLKHLLFDSCEFCSTCGRVYLRNEAVCSDQFPAAETCL